MNTNTQTMDSSGSASMLLLGLGAVGLAIGLFASGGLLSDGHAAFNTGSNVAWGLPVVAYVYMALASTGLAIVASLAMVFGTKELYPIAKRCLWLAIALLIGAFITLALELGHPFRLLWAVPAGMQTSSPMFWMGVWYAVALLFMAIKFAMVMKRDWSSPGSKAIGGITFAAEIAAAMTLGFVFGAMSMRPFWYDPMMPVFFVLSGLLAGVAFALFFTNLAYGFSQDNMPAAVRRAMTGILPAIFLTAIGVTALFVIGQMVTASYSNVNETHLVASHVYGSAPFQLALWVGLVLPFALMLGGLRKQVGMQVLAAVLVLVGLFTVRYGYIIGGQLVPMFKGTWYPDLIAYTPSATEWGVFIIGASASLLIYAIGDKLFKLPDSPDEQ